MALPYPVADDYQFVKGRFEHHGEYFKLIKQKLEGDTLFIVCVKDQNAKKINKRMIEYSSLSNDLQSKSKASQNLLSKIIKDYTSHLELTTVPQYGWVTQISETGIIFSTEQIYSGPQAPPPWLN